MHSRRLLEVHMWVLSLVFGTSAPQVTPLIGSISSEFWRDRQIPKLWIARLYLLVK
jgi:hypothetical protein